ncbi:LOW QUALITY PROTEIN: transcription factor TFIIIB component B'' homolog [Maniola hyperantus]|uniref:LOW QUALITY PROTEIN: transcription factor TFIIIB component B'' homolog n=1 Tax=Aphantopus hyperantus TaxID=2795564 RepID=UPI0037480DC3
MSTRRARIKAVTSLPPRRKNAVVAENKVKDAEKSTKSPRTPLNEHKSPRAKNVTESKTLENIGHNATEKLITSEKPPSLSGTTIGETLSNSSTSRVLHTPEKVHSLVDNKKNSSNVFASPAWRDSHRKTFASPIAPSPKVSKNLDLQRPHTPQRATPTAHKISENNELQIAERIVSKIDHNVKPKNMQINASDDYNIPSVPESTDDEAIDGIVPLKPAASIPKPIDVLKNEIISENAEVLFDPIIPLPSPSKVRPKLRPVPRLAPLRRNSVQGSASESEDENRRSLLNSRDRQAHEVHTLQSLPNRDVSRVRNDSVCSSVSQAPTQPAAAASPLRDKQQILKTRRQEETRRRMAMRRRRENAKRDTLTMYDLIFYNPTSNPLVLNEDEIKLKEAKEKQEAERVAKEKEVVVKPPDSPKKSAEPAPVPQIKLGPKGEIILDEQSLVIKQTESDRKCHVVHEGAWGTGGQYKKLNFCRAAGWSAPETVRFYRAHRRAKLNFCRAASWSAPKTVRFYRALAALGTDFTLMAQLFPDRTRKQLKFKFKKEERLNGAQIDKALRASLQFDIALLKAEFEEERAAAARQAEIEREKLNNEKQAERERLKTAKEIRMRPSRGAKALEHQGCVRKQNITNADDIIQHHILQKQKNHKAKQQTQPTSPSPKKISTMALVSSAAKPKEDVANIRTNTASLQVKTPESINALQIPTNIESGSLVVLTVNDPSSPSKKMLQTYIANGPGKLTPVALPPSILNYVVGYMKKGTPKGSNVSSPLLSPCSV